jgi:hypothetical protein
MKESRLKIEEAVLQNSFLKPKQYKFMDLDTPEPYLAVAIQTNSLRCYAVKIDLSDYPLSVCSVLVVSPKPLLDFNGNPLQGGSHPMHTLGVVNGCVQICHYHPDDWRPTRITLYQVIIKVRIWLEMYECHLQTGRTIDECLNELTN